MSSKMTQCKRILQYLDMFGSITAWQAMRDLGIMRLAARIHEIRARMGIDIQTKTVFDFNRFGERIRYSEYRRAA